MKRYVITICIIIILAIIWVAGSTNAEEITAMPVQNQKTVERVSRMPTVPQPLDVRDWKHVAEEYYHWILDPKTVIDIYPTVVIDETNGRFRMPSYLDSRLDDEFFTCVSPIIGAKLLGLDPQTEFGFDYVQSAKKWYDKRYGIYRHSVRLTTNDNPVIHSGIYGYYMAAVGVILASQYPEDREFQEQVATSAETFLKIAKGCGSPDNPDFRVLGYNLKTNQPEGRPEPMNRLGHAPLVAWMLLVGATTTDDEAKKSEYVQNAIATMKWYAEHPGRYEVTFAPGPLTAARLNAEYDAGIDMDAIFRGFFGTDSLEDSPWRIVAGKRFSGLDCDGLDGAIWGDNEEGFYAFTMGTLINPAWLTPVVRYDTRYANAIGRYLLNVANATRLLQGEGLTWEQHDHPDWKEKHDPKNLLFYESIASWDWGVGNRIRPYATSDPIRLGWNGNKKIDARDYHDEKMRDFSHRCSGISFYMGHHIGYLGAILQLTDVPGIVRWDCVKTDFFSSPTFPTYLVYNPYPEPKEFTFVLDNTQMQDIIDIATQTIVAKNVKDAVQITLPGETAGVYVVYPAMNNR